MGVTSFWLLNTSCSPVFSPIGVVACEGVAAATSEAIKSGASAAPLNAPLRSFLPPSGEDRNGSSRCLCWRGERTRSVQSTGLADAVLPVNDEHQSTTHTHTPIYICERIYNHVGFMAGEGGVHRAKCLIP